LPGFPGYTGPAGPKGDVGRDGRPGGPGRRVSFHLPLLPVCHPCLWIVPSYAYLYHCMTVQELKLCPVISQEFAKITTHYHYNTTSVFTDLFSGPGELVPEENFWTLWCKGRLTEADTPTIRLGTTPAGLTSANLHHLPHFLTGRMPFLPPNQQCQSTEGKKSLLIS